jgi:hypothetical protein
MTNSSARRAPAWAVLVGMALSLLTPLVLCSCGSKEEAPKDASYYKGPLQPKNERMKNAPRGEGGG